MPRHSRTHPPHILVVDDNVAVGSVVRQLLDRQGFRVDFRDHPEEALHLLEREGDSVDLLLTDIRMPGMDGTVLAERARALHPGLKVLFMSGYVGSVAERAALQHLLLDKPFEPDRLYSAVAESLRKPRTAT